MFKTKLNHKQQLFTLSQWKKLLANNANPGNHAPVVKLFNPRGGQTWLISECNETGMAFGLCDLGQGCPELGSVSMQEIVSIGYLERDLYFKGRKPITEYADDARENQAITV